VCGMGVEMRGSFFLGLLFCMCLTGAPASAEEACPKPKDSIPRGMIVSTGVGPSFWLGDVGSDSQVGMNYHFNLGYELLPYLGFEASWTTGSHNTDQPHPPAEGSYSTYALQGLLRVNLPLGRFDLFAHGGAGLMWAQPDILVRVEDFNSDLHLAWSADLGFAWHSSRRRIWLGAQAGVLGGVDFPGYLLSASVVIGLSL